MNNLFDGLNERQTEAVTATEGYYRIIAGAGSGKTKTLTHRFAYLVTELGISARNILCVTFTNKAANEMKGRIKRLLGNGFENALITTYHGFCVKVLKEDIYRLFFPLNFKILDVGNQKKILEEIYNEYEIKLDYSSFEKTLEYIYKEKVKLKYITQMSDPAYAFDPEKAFSLEEKIYLKYLAHQKKIYGLDFNDLIYFTIYLFENHEDVLNKWQERLHYIQVDEFQDSSKKELDIINSLCKRNNNLFVVGDPDQNIYEWRHSENKFLVNFDKNYPNVTTIILDQNYRSTPEILSVSNSLIEKNKNRVPKNLFTVNQSGKRVEHIHLKSEDDESKWIVKKIREIVETKQKQYSDIAILFRSSYVSRFLEQALYGENIPYQIHGGIRFFDRMEIRDSIAYLKLIAGNDDEAFLRIINVPKRQIGKTRIDALIRLQKELREDYSHQRSLFELLSENVHENIFFNTKAADFVNIIKEYRGKAKQNMKTSDILNEVLGRTGYKEYISMSGDMERFDNVTELLASITEFEQQIGEDISLEAYLQQLAVISDYESERSKNCVKLMTIHASKGLEFPYVIVAGMTEGVFPSWRTVDERKEQGIEEERRLCYVAMTRAMHELYLTESEGKTYGEIRKLPSRFLFDVDAVHIDVTGTIPEEIIKDLAAKTKQPMSNNNGSSTVGNLPNSDQTLSEKFKPGDAVHHKFFGDGEIMGVENNSGVYMIKFVNIDNPKPISMSYTGLTPAEPAADSDSANDKENEDKNKNENKNDNEKSDELIPDSPAISRKSNFNKKLDRLFESKRSQNQSQSSSQPEYSDLTEKIITTDDTATVADISSLPDVTENTDANDTDTIEADATDIPRSLYDAPPQILYDNSDRINLWNDDTIPKKGWICVDVIDLGYPNGECGMCGKEEIRYVHIMRHANGLTIGAGCVCAGKMEGNIQLAKERENSLKNRINRFRTFSGIPLKTSSKGNLYTKYKDTLVTFLRDKNNKDEWKFVEGGEFSKPFNSLEDAKAAAFMKIDAKI